MSDRELLELAAKAAGVELHEGDDEAKTLCQPDGYAWNPLTDDGDALRLMVKLRLVVSPWGGTIYVNKHVPNNPASAKEDFGPDGDPLAATRRAITRAAAEIGRGMS